MSLDQSIYQQLESHVAAGSPTDALRDLSEYLKAQERFHDLFEVLKMQLRLELGLPAAQANQETTYDEQTESRLERGLIDACRTVGELFFKSGRIREGWMYMRPVGDRAAAQQALATVEATDENSDELLEVLLHEAVDIERGYGLALSRLGTCNSITLFEQALASRPRSDQQLAAGLLVEHVHAELVDNLRADIARRQGEVPEGKTARQLLEGYPDLLRDGTYHLDTSHIASTVRFARVIDKPSQLAQALDIAQYGNRLHPQYKYPGDEPFLDLYPASIAFYQALLGIEVDAGIRYFTHKADSVDQQHFGLIAVEILIDLLYRCKRPEAALDAFAKRIPANQRTMGIAPTLLQLSQQLGDYSRMQLISRERNDLLSFTAALLQK